MSAETYIFQNNVKPIVDVLGRKPPAFVLNQK
jgi:hypothetical protein